MNRLTKCIAIALPLFACAITADAQSFQLGIRYEAEFSALMNSNDAGAGPALNYASHFTYLNFGIGGMYNINKNMGVAIDFLLSREGQNFTGNFANGQFNSATYAQVVSDQAYLNNLVVAGNYAAKAELNFIKIPVMFSLTTDNTAPIFLSFKVGPQINSIYNVAQEVNHTDEGYPNTNITPIELYKTVTLDGVAEIGLGFNLSAHWVLSTQLRFDYGFEDVENKDVMVSYNNGPSQRFYSSDRQSTNNATAGLLVGLDFKL